MHWSSNHKIRTFIISRQNIFLVCILLGISPASDYGLSTFRNPILVPSSRAGCKVWSKILHTLDPALEDGTDRGFRNVGNPQSDAGEIPKEYIQDSKHGESLKSRKHLSSRRPEFIWRWLVGLSHETFIFLATALPRSPAISSDRNLAERSAVINAKLEVTQLI